MRLAVLLLLIVSLPGWPPRRRASMAPGEASSRARRMPRTAGRGYSYGFPARVKDGVLHAQRKAEDAPGSLRIDGPIQPDGTAELSRRA